MKLAELADRDTLKEIAVGEVRRFAADDSDFVAYGLLSLVLIISSMNFLLLFQIAGYSSMSLAPIVGLLKVGVLVFTVFMLLAFARQGAKGAVERWDKREAGS